MQVSVKDRDILVDLAMKIAAIADLPVQREKKRLWCHLNECDSLRPMLYICPEYSSYGSSHIPWHEMNCTGDLTLKCQEGFARDLEYEMRRKIYQWHHMPGDMVVEPVIYSPLIIQETPILAVQQETIGLAQKYNIQIKGPEDIQKIKMPEVTYDPERSQEIYHLYEDLFGGILVVKKALVNIKRFAPWDELIKYTGVQEALLDLALRPHYIHELMERLTAAHRHRLKQYQELSVLTRDNTSFTTGNGGLGYTRELPSEESQLLSTKNLWGAAQAQIFSEVSPAMHEEFALEYEKEILDGFGLVYYGCCEPLDKKIPILKKHLPNLRKISCSPWADVESFAKQCQDDYVISLKPNPNILAGRSFDLSKAKKDLLKKLEATRGCHVEVVMKDISTLANDPIRLWRWEEMAKEVIQEFASTL